MTFLLATAILIAPTTLTVDLEFRRSVEEWVMQVRPEATIPEPYFHLIGAMGHKSYVVREAASRCLLYRAGNNDRWMFWGRHYRDAEIRLRCNNILQCRYLCRRCFGAGYCAEMLPGLTKWDSISCRRCGRSTWEHTSGEEPVACPDCKGAGQAWVRGAFE